MQWDTCWLFYQVTQRSLSYLAEQPAGHPPHQLHHLSLTLVEQLGKRHPLIPITPVGLLLVPCTKYQQRHPLHHSYHGSLLPCRTTSRTPTVPITLSLSYLVEQPVRDTHWCDHTSGSLLPCRKTSRTATTPVMLPLSYFVEQPAGHPLHQSHRLSLTL